jgi:hypothetical protein
MSDEYEYQTLEDYMMETFFPDDYDPLRQGYSATSIQDLSRQVEERKSRICTKNEIMKIIDRIMDLFEFYYEECYEFRDMGENRIHAQLNHEYRHVNFDDVRETNGYEMFKDKMNSFQWNDFGWDNSGFTIDDDGTIYLFKKQ